MKRMFEDLCSVCEQGLEERRSKKKIGAEFKSMAGTDLSSPINCNKTGGGWGRAPALQVMTPQCIPVLVHGDVNAPDKTGSMARDLG